MDQRKSVVSIVGMVIQAIFLAFLVYVFSDVAVYTARTGSIPNFRYVTNALALIVPGIVLERAYNEYHTGSPTATDTITRCAIVNAVLDLLPFVPSVGQVLFGVSPNPMFRSFGLRFFELRYGPGTTSWIFLLALVVQGVLPFVLVGICEGKEYLASRGPKELKAIPFQILGTIACAWLGMQATAAILRGGLFDHSWVIVGFIPIPGQIMAIFPIVLAAGVIIVIWSRPGGR